MLDVLFGKVDVCVDTRENLRQLPLQGAHLAREALGIQHIAGAHLRVALAVDHIDKPLRRSEGEFSVQKGSLCKFAPFRKSRAPRDTARFKMPRVIAVPPWQ